MMMMMGSSCAGVLAIKNQARLGWQKRKNNKLNKCSSIRRLEGSMYFLIILAPQGILRRKSIKILSNWFDL